MTTYAGDPNAPWPTEIPLLSDLVIPKASDIDVPLEALIDRTAIDKSRLDKLEALSWAQSALNLRQVTPTAFLSTSAVFAPGVASWLLISEAKTVLETKDCGNTFSSIIAGAGSGENCKWGASDASGNLVISTDTRYVFERTASSGAVTKVDAVGAAYTAIESQVAYDAVRDRWLLFANDSTTTVFNVSSNRTSWSAATVPPLLTYAAGTVQRMRSNPTTGRVLFVTYDASPARIYVHRTDDAAQTWSTTIIDQGSLFAPAKLGLSFNAEANEWILSATRSADNQYTRVWRSTDDGVTWTPATSLSNAYIFAVAGVGQLWAGLATRSGSSTPEVVWSSDKGVTWRRAGVVVPNCIGIFSGGGGFVVTGLAMSWFGHRMTAPELGTLT